MFERFKITRELYAACDVVETNRIFVLDAIHPSVLDLGVRLMKERSVAANDAMTFVVTYAWSKSQLADPERLKAAGISPTTHMQVEYTLRKVAEIASLALRQRGGDSALIATREFVETAECGRTG